MRLPVFLLAATLAAALLHGQDHRPPHHVVPTVDPYPEPPGADPVGRLAARLADGSLTLARTPGTGYLPAVLTALGVDLESQLLVFSKTSVQARLIGPDRPRALYFNDTVAVGFVPGSDLLEFASEDPRVGTVFYTLRQSAPVARVERRDSCLSCHVTPRTLDVPGMITGSVVTTPEGFPMYGPVRTPDHRTPFAERWGGWYVTGDAGRVRHGGTPAGPEPPATDAYPSPHSDIAALLVFEHQWQLTNLLIRLGRDWRSGAPPDILDALVVGIADYMLFVDEAHLAGPVRGSSGYAARFAGSGPFDRHGRSLRELDLRQRLFRYPCSYLIYSPVVDALPDAARLALYRRLWAVLSGEVGGPRYAGLTLEDRRAIVDILLDTRTGLPPDFHPL